MNGRALVEFDHHANIGWFDIDVDYLKVIDRPLPKKEAPKPSSGKAKVAAEKAQPSAAPATGDGEKQLSPLEMARLQDSGGGQGGGQTAAPKEEAASQAASPKMSTADILAAARGKKPAAPEQADAESPAKAPEPKAATPKASKPAGEMTLAEKLAAARGETVVAAEPAAEAVDETVDRSPESPSVVAEEPATAAEDEEPVSSSASSEAVDKSTMSIDEMIAWCRAHDGS